VRAVRGGVDEGLLFPPDAGVADRSGPAPEHPDHHHEHFATEIWTVPDGMSGDALEARLLGDPALLRAKGFVELGGALHLVQLVGRRLEIEPSELEPPPASRGKLVLISRA
jgi:hypothetical protein